jgi:hypothetical protein
MLAADLPLSGHPSLLAPRPVQGSEKEASSPLTRSLGRAVEYSVRSQKGAFSFGGRRYGWIRGLGPFMSAL